MTGTQTGPEESSSGTQAEMRGVSRDSITFIHIGTQINHPLPTTTSEVRYSLPSDSDFTGRDDELKYVTGALNESAGTRVVTIDGMPGQQDLVDIADEAAELKVCDLASIAEVGILVG